MYMPPQFDAKDRAIAAELMRAHPFANLISNDRRESHAAMYARYSEGSPDEQALAVWMQRLGMKTDAAQVEEH